MEHLDDQYEFKELDNLITICNLIIMYTDIKNTKSISMIKYQIIHSPKDKERAKHSFKSSLTYPSFAKSDHITIQVKLIMKEVNIPLTTIGIFLMTRILHSYVIIFT
jgi:hypothetical protein